MVKFTNVDSKCLQTVNPQRGFDGVWILDKKIIIQFFALLKIVAFVQKPGCLKTGQLPKCSRNVDLSGLKTFTVHPSLSKPGYKGV